MTDIQTSVVCQMAALVSERGEAGWQRNVRCQLGSIANRASVLEHQSRRLCQYVAVERATGKKVLVGLTPAQESEWVKSKDRSEVSGFRSLVSGPRRADAGRWELETGSAGFHVRERTAVGPGDGVISERRKGVRSRGFKFPPADSGARAYGDAEDPLAGS